MLIKKDFLKQWNKGTGNRRGSWVWPHVRTWSWSYSCQHCIFAALQGLLSLAESQRQPPATSVPSAPVPPPGNYKGLSSLCLSNPISGSSGPFKTLYWTYMYAFYGTSSLQLAPRESNFALWLYNKVNPSYNSRNVYLLQSSLCSLSPTTLATFRFWDSPAFWSLLSETTLARSECAPLGVVWP